MASTRSASTALRKTLPQSLEEARVSCTLSLQGLPAPQAGLQIPGYHLDQVLGQGAFAEVWRATQLRTQKKVAVKIFKLRSGPHWLFLQREVERLSQLDKHPHIVSLLDADLTADPPYYTMDLLQRGSLQAQVDSGIGVDPARAALWMEQVCQALDYVHAKGLIHCDLKPANILLDDTDKVRLMDFGHSRILTASSGTLGTFFYMAPEQTLLADMAQPMPPDVRWDLFAVGSSFFALLSGRTPWGEFEPGILRQEHLSGKLKAFRDAVAQNPLPDLQRLSGGHIDRDLAAIVAKCCQADPAQRYASAQEILADLKARRAGLPVSPLATDRPYLASKFLGRNRPVMAVIAVVLAGLGGWAAYRAVLQRRGLQGQLAQLYALRGREREASGDPLSAAVYEDAANMASPAKTSAWSLLFDLPMAPVSVLEPRREAGTAFLPDGQRALMGWKGGRLALLELKSGKVLRLLDAPSPIQGFSLSTDASLAAAASADGSVRIWELESGKLRVPVLGPTGGPAQALAWRADGLQVASGSESGAVRVWDIRQGSPVGNAIQLPGAVARLMFSPGGLTLACLTWDPGKKSGALELLDWGNGWQRAFRLDLGAPGSDLAFIGKGSGLAIVQPNGHARILSRRRSLFRDAWAVTAELKAPLQAPQWSGLSKGGGALIRMGGDKRLRLWTLGQGHFVPSRLGVGELLRAAAWDGDGQALATLSESGELKLWDLVTHRLRAKALNMGRDATALTLTGPGSALIFSPPMAREWDLLRGEPKGRSFYSESGDEALVAPGGHWMLQFPSASAGEMLILPVSRPESYASDYLFRRNGAANLGRAVMSPDGKTLLTAYGRRARFWDLEQGRPLAAEIKTAQALTAARFDSTSSWALLSYPHEGQIYELAQPSKAAQVLAWKAPPRAVVVLPGGIVVAGGAGGDLTLWEAQSSKPRVAMPHAAPGLLGLAFAAEEGTLCCLTKQGILRLGMDLKAKAKSLALAPGYQKFSLGADGETYLAIYGREFRAYDAHSGKPLAGPVLLQDEPTCLTLSYDHLAAAAAFKDGGIQVIGLQGGQALGERLAAGGEPLSLAFSRDGHGLLVSCSNGAHRLWALPWLRAKPPSPQRLHERTLVAAHTRISGTGELERLSYGDWKRAWRRSQGEATP